MDIKFDPGSITEAIIWVEQSEWNTMRACISALKPAAFTLKTEMRKATENNRFGWTPLARYTRSAVSFEKPRKTARRWKKGRKFKGAGKKGQYHGVKIGGVFHIHRPNQAHKSGSSKAKLKGLQFLWKLKNVFRYLVKEDFEQPRAHVGVLTKFTDRDAVAHFDKFQAGGTINNYGQVTPSMRRFWGAFGMPLHRSTLKQPARPLIVPLVKAMRGQIGAIMRRRFVEKLEILATGLSREYEPGRSFEISADQVRRKMAKLAAQGERTRIAA